MYLLSVMSNGDKDVHGIAFSFNIFNTNVLLFCKTSLNNLYQISCYATKHVMTVRIHNF